MFEYTQSTDILSDIENVHRLLFIFTYIFKCILKTNKRLRFGVLRRKKTS